MYGLPLEESLPTLPRLNGRKTGKEDKKQRDKDGLEKAVNFSLTWWMFYTFLYLKPEIFFFVIFILFLHLLEVSFLF